MYRSFIDQRELGGIPFFWNVVSNLPLLAAGAWGLYVVAWADTHPFVERGEKWSYAICFGAVALAGIGSSYFHLAPDADRLMWDRLPIALGFMALLAGVIGDRRGPQASLRALGPLLIAGAASVFYWRWSMLRGTENIVPYAIVQYGALAAIMVHGALRSRYSRRLDLFIIAAIYGAAKIAEMLDRAIYAAGGIVSGHTRRVGGVAASADGAAQAAAQPAIVRPPDTLITWPVMNPASSEARKATSPGMSSGWPTRFMGIARTNAS